MHFSACVSNVKEKGEIRREKEGGKWEEGEKRKAVGTMNVNLHSG